MKGRIAEINLKILEVLLDGNSHTIESFKHLGLHEKTIRRTLRVFEMLPGYKVFRLKVNPGKWRCRLLDEKPKTKIKECLSCKLISKEPEKDFHKNKSNFDGLNRICKSCHKEYQTNYINKNRDQINKKRRNWWKVRSAALDKVT